MGDTLDTVGLHNFSIRFTIIKGEMIMSHAIVPNEYTPVIPDKIRTIAYFTTVIVSALTLGITLLAPVWLNPELAAQVKETATILGSTVALITGALGVAYRPTKW